MENCASILWIRLVNVAAHFFLELCFSFFSFSFFVPFLLFFRCGIFLYRLGWPGIHFLDQAVHKLTAVLLPQCPQS